MDERDLSVEIGDVQLPPRVQDFRSESEARGAKIRRRKGHLS